MQVPVDERGLPVSFKPELPDFRFMKDRRSNVREFSKTRRELDAKQLADLVRQSSRVIKEQGNAGQEK